MLDRGVDQLVNKHVTGGFKDSFHEIEPVDPRYSVLFSADWIWMDARDGGSVELEWKRVSSDSELLAWEERWADGDDDAKNHPRQFPSALLKKEDIEFWSASAKGEFVGGVLFNLTPPVVGISNLFTVGGFGEAVWNDLPQLIARQFPGLDMVGYERGSDLELAIRAEFELIGRLRIWVN